MLDKAATKRAGLRVEIMRDGWREVRSTEETGGAADRARHNCAPRHLGWESLVMS